MTPNIRLPKRRHAEGTRLERLFCFRVEELNGRNQVGIGGRENSDVIGIFPSKPNHIGRQICIDAFL